MEVQTEQINAAIEIFLESINAQNLQAIKISFKEKSSDPGILINCGWEWDPIKKDLIWKCYP
ncbi:hypothetical protein [Psychroserpens luteolus]|uniref:hypothetical protein n=1 Tax=Psychroserpens luteolus TaxID=2855840 RepID=UPI001E5A710C|nr:hypothetical protein [Psychroserpens luteolus]MCD2258840.1 hypothetical protein [Psychroserpens luteolus]